MRVDTLRSKYLVPLDAPSPNSNSTLSAVLRGWSASVVLTADSVGLHSPGGCRTFALAIPL